MRLRNLSSQLSGLINKGLVRTAIPVAGVLLFAGAPRRALAECLKSGGPVTCLTQIGDVAFAHVGTPKDFTTIVTTIIVAFLSILGVIFIGMVLFAGYNWMTAMGDKEKVTRAKDTLISAVIGLILIIASYAITRFVLTQLGAT